MRTSRWDSVRVDGSSEGPRERDRSGYGERGGHKSGGRQGHNGSCGTVRSAGDATLDKVIHVMAAVAQFQAVVVLTDPPRSGRGALGDMYGIPAAFARALDAPSTALGTQRGVAWAKRSGRRCAKAFSQTAFRNDSDNSSNGNRGGGGYVDAFDDVCRGKSVGGGGRVCVWDAEVLVQEVLADPLLERLAMVVIDDFDQRTLETDLMLSFTRLVAMRRQEDLHIGVVCCTEASAEFALQALKGGTNERANGLEATLVDCRSASKFDGCVPVEVQYREMPCRDITGECCEVITQLHLNSPLDSTTSGVVVVLPNEAAVDACLAKMERRAGLVNLNVFKWVESGSRNLYVELAPPGTRNCILASGVLERKGGAPLSASFHGIGVVVDSLLTTRTWWDAAAYMQRTTLAPVTKAEAFNRARLAAGSVHGRGGVALRLCPEAAFDRLEASLPPEIQRVDLTACILQLKALSVSDVVHFEFISPPPSRAVISALDALHALKAVDANGAITHPLGERLARLLPLDPKLAKVLLLSIDRGCSREALIVVACLVALKESGLFVVASSSRGLNARVREERRDAAIATFGAKEGDLVFLLNVYTTWQTVPRNKRIAWCDFHALNQSTLHRAEEVRRALQARLKQVCGLAQDDLLSCYSDVEAIQKCVAGALFMCAAKLQGDGRTYCALSAGGPQHMELHPASVFARFGGSPPAWIVVPEFAEKLRSVTAVRSQWLLEAAPHFYTDSNRSTQARAHAALLVKADLNTDVVVVQNAVRSRPSAFDSQHLKPKRRKANNNDDDAPQDVDSFLDAVKF